MAFTATRRCLGVFLHDVKLKSIICGVKQSGCWRCRLGARRHLLTDDVIKLQEFQKRKLAMTLKHGQSGEYIQMFQQRLQRNELILKDELKVLLHLCQTPEDMAVAKAAIHRYHKENQNMASSEFKFGPLFMRLCYELNMEELAASTITDKTLKGFFPDSTSFNIVMDMLFTKGCYESALGVLSDMKSHGVDFNKDSFILATGICYKLNTDKSYRICIAVLEEAQIKGFPVPRHAYYFAVALALEQEDTEKAKYLFSQIMTTDTKLSLNLRVWVLATAGAVSDVVSVFSSALEPKSPSFVKKPEFCQEVVDLVLRRVQGSPACRAQLGRLLDQLQRSGQVTALSLDEMLCNTPGGKRRQFGELVVPRKVSRPPLRRLRSALLLE